MRLVTRIKRASSLVFPDVPGQRDGRNITAALDATDSSHQLVTVFIRHAYVGDQHVDALSAVSRENLVCLLGRGRRRHLRSGMLQEDADEFAGVALVIDNEDSDASQFYFAFRRQLVCN